MLIVSDDRDLSDFLSEGLVYAGLWTSVIADALQTLEVFRLRSFDAVLVDFSSGGPAESIALLDEIRRTPGIGDVPVVISSRIDKNRLFAWESGVDGFIVRPYHVDELLAELAAVLARSPEQRAAHRAERLAEVAT